jgi:filamentous hemagglutinin
MSKLDRTIWRRLAKRANPITSFNLNSSGQAIVEIKTGGATLTPNQSAVYPSVQAGTATSVGGNAAKAFQVPQPSTLTATPVIVLWRP